MGGGTVPIPAIFIGNTDGETIRSAALADSLNATMQIYVEIPRPELADTLASFTSRGPGQGGSIFKPDVSAPGLGIRSTGAGTGDGPAILGGTSMASPHVAGLAALMREIHPDLAPADIKALIQNGTVTSNAGGPGTDSPYPLARQGVGVVRANLSANLDTFAEPGGVSFGRVNPTGKVKVQRDVTLRNLTGSSRFFLVEQVENQTFPGMRVSGPRFINVPANGTATATLTLRMDPSAGPYDDGFFSQTEVDGWFVFKTSKESLRVGYLAAVDPASREDASSQPKHQVRIRNRGPSLGWVEGFTLAGRPPRAAAAAGPSLGFRTSEIAGYSVVELGLATDVQWESLSSLEVDIYVDVDCDGQPDVLLVTADSSAFGGDPGTVVTAQIDLATGDGFLDWNAVADYNDQSAILPFTLASSGGLVPDSFDYLMAVFTPDGNVAQQLGSIDLRDEIVPILNDFGLPGGGSVTMTTKGGRGKMLWLFPNNAAGDQSFAVRVH